jgi:hypothetical protein
MAGLLSGGLQIRCDSDPHRIRLGNFAGFPSGGALQWLYGAGLELMGAMGGFSDQYKTRIPDSLEQGIKIRGRAGKRASRAANCAY